MAGWNYNVKLCLANCALQGVADSIWTGTVIAAFVYIMSGSKNSAVGYIEACYGLSTLITAFPVGVLADKLGRSPVIAVGGVLMLLAALGTTAVVWECAEADKQGKSPPSWAMGVLAGCMALWGVAQGISQGPTQALYADSIREGERSRYYQILFVVYLTASAVGPAASVVIFRIWGNGWSLYELRNVLLVGMGLEALAAVPMFFYDDSKALERQETDRKAKDERTASDAVQAQNQSARNSCITRDAIPYVMFASGLIVALGSGMTVKFFPLFFKNTLKLSPLEVQAIYVVAPLAIAAFSGVGTMLAKRIGRVEAILAVSACGLGCLVAMALAYDQMTPLECVCIYVVRTGLMNCTYPLTESIVMDAVPRDRRARWKSLESVAAFGWCGSAMIGGFLADHSGYAFTFLITAGVQGAGLSLLLIIRGVVPPEQQDNSTSGDELKANAATSEKSPLLVVAGDHSGTPEDEPLLVNS